MSGFSNSNAPKRGAYVPPHLRNRGGASGSAPGRTSNLMGSAPPMNSRAAALASTSTTSRGRQDRGDTTGDARQRRLAKFEADQALEEQAVTKVSDADVSKETPNNASEAESGMDEKSREEAERERHPDLFSEETVVLSKYYTDSSPVFNQWTEVRNDGYKNEHIGNFFDKKNANKSQTHREGAYVGANIGKIFCQFYRYAVDVDIGTYYTQRAAEIATATGKCTFLDFGFSPGGMSDLLLNAHENIHGVGVSLEPSKGGNVWLPEMDTDQPPFDRFKSVIGDVIDMARDDMDIPKEAGIEENFDGFDFVIIGITIHQEWHGENMNELKDLLHFAQLYFAFKYLKQGGICLMRNHMSVRLVDAHMLALMISMFNIDKYVGREVGRLECDKAIESAQEAVAQEEARKSELASGSKSGKSSLSQMFERQNLTAKTSDATLALKRAQNSRNALEVSAVATKPFSTFSMRKTFWTLYQGFDCSDERRADILDRLTQVLKPDLFAYGFNIEENRFNHPVLHAENMSDLLAKYGEQMVKLLETVWCKQVLALEGFMAGLTDKFCRRGMSCNRRGRGPNDRCNLAHSDADMIPQVLEALREVDSRSRVRLMGFQS